MAQGKQTVSAFVALREFHNGDWLGFPVADPGKVSYGPNREEVVLELELFLSDHLARIRADGLNDFAASPDTRLIDVTVPVMRDDLPARLESEIPVRMPCVVIDEQWVIVLPLQQTLYVPEGAGLEQTIVDEAVRHVAASEMSPRQIIELLGGVGDELVELEVEIDREGQLSASATSRRKIAEANKSREAQKLLREVGRVVSSEDDEGPPPQLIEREGARDGLEALILGERRLGALVVGREACGKSAVIGEVLRGREHVYVTSGAQLVAGQSHFGQWQQRVHDVMGAAEHLDAVLWFDDLADLFAARDGSAGIAAVMRPYLDDNRVRVVGELRPDDLERVESRNFGFFQNLHPIRVEPLEAEATLAVLEDRQQAAQEVDEGTPRFTDRALSRVVDLVERYEPYRALPGKAVGLFDELCASHTDALAEFVADQEEVVVDEREVFSAFSANSGVPEFLLRKDIPLAVERVVEFFHRRIVGQRDAIRRVAEAVCTVKASLQPATKPLANLLFVGPTGVGKTEVARTLARFLFGSENRMIRFDMSEYMAAGAAERLIRGSERDDGLLTRAIRKQPFSVVLLDEIEKAHPSVFDLLLQVLGEGRLSDARGRTAYFHNAIVIMTSNLGAAHRRSEAGFGSTSSDSKDYYDEQVEKHFRPEFVNRLDRVISFAALAPDEIREVTEIALRKLRQRQGLSERGVELRVSDGAIAHLARAGYSEAYGARQLRRRIDDDLAAPIAALIAEAGEKARGAVLEVRCADEPDAEMPDDARLARRDLGPLQVQMFRGSTATHGGKVRDIEALSSRRREFRRWRRAWRVRQVDDRVAFLSTELDVGKKRARRMAEDAAYAAEVGRKSKERDQLRDILAELDASVQAIGEAEELAITAMLDDEPADEFFEHVDQMSHDYWRALVAALLALETRRDEIVLTLLECDDQGALELWLAGVLEAAEARSWRVEGHLVDGDDSLWQSDDFWPPDAPFGPARSPDEIREWLDATGGPRKILLHVSGPLAGGLLACEAGIIELHNAPRRTDTATLEARTTSFRHKPSTLLELSEFEIEPALGGIELRNAERSRIYDFASRRCEVRGEDFGRIDWDEYFQRLEELTAQDLLRFERDLDLDRRQALFTAQMDGFGFDEVRRMANGGKKIQAIKLFRELTTAGLREAKQAVEAMMEDP